MVRLETIFEAGGRTPLVPLTRLSKDVRASVCVKCENLGPSGSSMDRVVPRLIEEAEAAARIAPGGTLVMATRGDGGVAAAAAGAIRGYRTILVVTDRTSQAKLDIMKAYGAEVVVCPAGLEREDLRSSHAVAERLSREVGGATLLDLFGNPLAVDAHYRTTGPEIYEDTEGKITHLVACMGSGATIMGAARYLREKKPEIATIGVDAEGSILFDYFHHGRLTKPHPYRLEGVGSDHLPPLIDFRELTDVVKVTDRDAFHTARSLARQEGILGGGSAGAAVGAALRIARELSPDDFVVAILADSGSRHLATIFSDEWMRENQYLSDRPSVPVTDLLSRKPEGFGEVMTLEAGSTVHDALNLMKKLEISQIPVTREGKLVGSIREDQMIDLLVHDVDMGSVTLEQVMEEPFPVVAESVGAREIQQHLAAGHPAVLVRGTDGNLGILTKFDLIHHLST